MPIVINIHEYSNSYTRMAYVLCGLVYIKSIGKVAARVAARVAAGISATVQISFTESNYMRI